MYRQNHSKSTVKLSPPDHHFYVSDEDSEALNLKYGTLTAPEQGKDGGRHVAD